MIDKILGRITGARKIEIKPPDIIVHGARRINAVRYLVGREASYGLRDLDEAGYKNIIDKYTILLSRLPPGSEIKIVKMRIDLSKIISRLTNEILNLKATIDVVMEEHTRKKAEAKLRILEKLYEEILSGKPIDRIILIVKIHGEGGSVEEARRTLDTMESLVTPLVTSLTGIKLGKPGKHELINILKYEIGLTGSQPLKPILVETAKPSALLPLPPRKKPELEEKGETIPLGIEIETGWPVLLPVETLNKHMVIIGPTGRGKTTLLATLIHGLTTLNEAIVTGIDFKGDLARLSAETLISVKTPRQLPINILQPPPRIEKIDWIIGVADALSNTLGYPAEKITTVISEYIGRRMDGNMIVSDPRLAQLAPLISLLTDEPKYAELLETFKENTIYDLSRLGESYQNAYSGTLIHIYKHHVFNNTANKGLRILAVDEAWRITRLRGLLEIVKEGRSRKVGVILAVQNPSDIPQEIMENAHTLVMFGSPNEKYLKQAVEILGIRRTVASKLKYLGIGEALMINALDPHPLIVRIEPLGRETIISRPHQHKQ